MATFTQDEVDFLKPQGNEECAKTWLGLWDTKRAIKQDQRDFMIEKYERKRYYLEPASPLMALPSGRQLAANKANSQNLNGVTNGIQQQLLQQQQQKANDLAVLKSVTLTPPSSIRLNKPPQSSNGMNHRNGQSIFQEQFQENTGSPLFKQCGPKAINGHRPNSSSASSTGSDVNNKFTPDTDFVADFSKADFFNVTTKGHSNVNNNGLVNSLVGSNNNKNGFVMMNGSDNSNSFLKATSNGQVLNGIMENFADFEHNQIYNAAGM